MTEKEGMRVFQAHLPVSLHRKLSEFSQSFSVSKSEIARNAIRKYLKDKIENTLNSTRKSRCGEGRKNEKIKKALFEVGVK